MPQSQEKEISKTNTVPLVPDVPSIVALFISSVMVNRSDMQLMESALDRYLKSLTPEQKQEKREEIRKQLTDGRLALESLLQRFLSS
jgi:hypothetical protein